MSDEGGDGVAADAHRASYPRRRGAFVPRIPAGHVARDFGYLSVTVL